MAIIARRCSRPASVQEMFDFTFLAFDIADEYRNPVVILADGMLGQMKEPLDTRKPGDRDLPAKTWALTGCAGRKPQLLKSLYLGEARAGQTLLGPVAEIRTDQEERNPFRSRIGAEDADLMVVAFGSAARIAKTAVAEAREEGLKVGLFRPISLYPLSGKAAGRPGQKSQGLPGDGA